MPGVARRGGRSPALRSDCPGVRSYDVGRERTEIGGSGSRGLLSRMVGACGCWWRSQRFANLKGSSGVHVFSQCTNHKWEIVSAPPNAVQRNLPPSTSGRGCRAKAHIPESIKSPPPPHLVPTSVIFWRSTSLSPLFYSWPVNCFWYLPTLGGGEAVFLF